MTFHLNVVDLKEKKYDKNVTFSVSVYRLEVLLNYIFRFCSHDDLSQEVSIK